MESYEIVEYDILEWSCGSREDYVCWYDIEVGQGFGLLYQYTGNGPGPYYRQDFHSNNLIFNLI